MMRFIFILVIGLIVSCDTERTIPPLEADTFLKFYGTDGEQTGVDFVLTNDNAIVMVGNSTLSNRLQMIYVVKVDLDGKVIWEKMIGLPDKNNAVKDIELHPDGRLVIAGETEMTVGNRDVFLTTMDGDGTRLDSIRYGLSQNSIGDEEVSSVTIISTGLTNSAGYIVAGSTTDISTPSLNDTKDGMVLRFTDSPLAIISDASWRSKGIMDAEDVVVKMIQVDNNTYYGFGYTNRQRNGSRDFKYWLFKLNDDGGEIGNGEGFFDMLSPSVEDEKLQAVIDVNTSDLFDAGFLLCGIATNQSGDSKPYFVKLERILDLEPSTDVQAEFYGNNLGVNIEANLNGYYNLVNNDFLILTTQNINANLVEDLSLFKLDREIQPVWDPEVFGGESFDEAGAVLQLPNEKIMVLGTMTVGGLNGQKKMALMKLNSDGKLLR
jgi:hypothetical protein